MYVVLLLGYNIEDKIYNCLKLCKNHLMSCVKVQFNVTDWFPIVRQGDSISPNIICYFVVLKSVLSVYITFC